jgi:hypothetical protein
MLLWKIYFADNKTMLSWASGKVSNAALKQKNVLFYLLVKEFDVCGYVHLGNIYV